MIETKHDVLTRKVSAGLSALLALGVLAYVLWTGIPILAHWLAPGIWGYVAAAAFLAGTAPIPLLLLVILSGASLRRFIPRSGPLMLVSLGTIFVASFAGAAHWPAWAAAVVVLTAVWLVRTANRAVLLAPVR
jgi:hypothetical protein